MKKYIIITMLALMCIGALVGQALSLDSRKVPIQMADSFDTITFACSADTLYQRVVVPSYTTEAWIISATGGVDVCADSLYTETAKNTILGIKGRLRYVRVPAATPFSIPTKTKTYFYIRRSAAGTASTVSIIFKKI